MARAIYVQVRGQRYIAEMTDDGHLRSLHCPGDYLQVPLSSLTASQLEQARERARFAWQLRQPHRATTGGPGGPE